MKNLQNIAGFDIKIMDRTGLIIDIFGPLNNLPITYPPISVEIQIIITNKKW